MNSQPARSADRRPTVTLKLESMVYGGEALGRAEGRAQPSHGGD